MLNFLKHVTHIYRIHIDSQFICFYLEIIMSQTELITSDKRLYAKRKETYYL